MSEMWDAFQEWAGINLPRGYVVPPLTKWWVEALRHLPRDSIEAARSNRNDLRFLIGVQSALIGAYAYSLGNVNALEGILWVRQIQLSWALDLKAIQKRPEQALTVPERVFHPERLRWGFDLAKPRGRPGRDRLKFLLLLTPYRRLIDEEVKRKTYASMAEVHLRASEEKKRQEKKTRGRSLCQSRNSVSRAWKELNQELPGGIIAMLLAAQFHIWRDWQKEGN